MVLNQTTKGEWYVLAIIQTCDDWTQMGYPKLPYTQYDWANGAWQQVALDPAFIGQTANLLVAVMRARNPGSRIDRLRRCGAFWVAMP